MGHRPGAHRHLVKPHQPLAVASHRLRRQPAPLERRAVLRQHDHPPPDARRVPVMPHQLQLLALGVEAERAAWIGVDGDLHEGVDATLALPQSELPGWRGVTIERRLRLPWPAVSLDEAQKRDAGSSGWSRTSASRKSDCEDAWPGRARAPRMQTCPLLCPPAPFLAASYFPDSFPSPVPCPRLPSRTPRADREGLGRGQADDHHRRKRRDTTVWLRLEGDDEPFDAAKLDTARCSRPPNNAGKAAVRIRLRAPEASRAKTSASQSASKNCS